MVADRSRIEALLDLMGSPQRAYPSVHLTGTNGKTSVARMIDSLLRAHGLRTGRYTSPHLETVRERISIDGDPISEERFVAVYDEVAPLADLIDQKAAAAAELDDHIDRVTYFELTTALAFAAFADAPVDVATVEVGLGGAWDATNVLHAGVCVITPIGLDNMELLGDTVGEIATEKAGIIHSGATVICAVQEPEALEVIAERCAEVGATLLREGVDFGVLGRTTAVGGQVISLQGLGGAYDEVFVPLHGAHQAQNAALALAAVEMFLGGVDDKRLEIDNVRDGFAETSSPGRLERIRSAPTILLDAAHNPHGMAATVRALEEEFSFRRLVGVFAVLADKDAEGELALLDPVLSDIVITRNSSPRAMPARRLAELAVEVFGPDRVHVEPQLPDAIERAVELAEQDLDGELSGVGVLITGSVVTVADARLLLRR
ncbi:MAG TPA: folylpolyglutamate synthase/dihydrofolate synthase family protein [Micromonosporaceae bacterium]